jgi:hypothetical protein
VPDVPSTVRAAREKGVTFNMYRHFPQHELDIPTVPGGAPSRLASPSANGGCWGADGPPWHRRARGCVVRRSRPPGVALTPIAFVNVTTSGWSFHPRAKVRAASMLEHSARLVG